MNFSPQELTILVGSAQESLERAVFDLPKRDRKLEKAFDFSLLDALIHAYEKGCAVRLVCATTDRVAV